MLIVVQFKAESGYSNIRPRKQNVMRCNLENRHFLTK